MDIEQIERFVQNRPDMAQAMYHDIIPLSAFVSFAAAIRRAALEEAAQECTNYALSHSFDENDRTIIYEAGDAIRALATKEPQ